MTETKVDKVSKSFRLESDLNNRLIVLCKHLGVNPNAYLLNKVGEAISRDEVAFLASKSVNEMNEKLSAFMQMVEEVATEEKEKS